MTERSPDMHSYNPTANTKEKPLKRSTIKCTQSKSKVGSQQHRLAWNLQLAKRASLTGNSSGLVFFFFPPSFISFMSETGQGKPLPSLFLSLCCSLRAPPGRLALQHHKHLFCFLHIYIHTHQLLLLEGRHKAHTVSTTVHFVSRSAYAGRASMTHFITCEKNKHGHLNRTRISCSAGAVRKPSNSPTAFNPF